MPAKVRIKDVNCWVWETTNGDSDFGWPDQLNGDYIADQGVEDNG